MGYAILKECSTGYLYWEHLDHDGSVGFTTASWAPSDRMTYSDRAVANRAMQVLEARHAKMVEATKRRRKFKTHPATYTVIEITPDIAQRLKDRKAALQAAMGA